MLTSLDFLSPGSAWPPPSEKERLARYEENEKLFDTKHSDAWKQFFVDLAARSKKSNATVETALNYHQLISKKTADFVCGEPPKIETEGSTDKLMEALGQQKFFKRLYQAVIDVSRYGDAPIKFRGKGLSAVSPKHWYPVVDPTDQTYVTHDVIAYTTNAKDGKDTELYAEIHVPGSIEIRRMHYDAQKGLIGQQIESPKSENTSLKISAVQVLQNLTTSSSVHGIDDYAIINTLIKDAMWRLHCTDTVLDEHSEPSMSGPESALEWDERFQAYFVPLGNYFKRNYAEDPDLKYITWDGNLDSSFAELELLFDQLYILSEMGQAFADAGGDASDSSGTALKLRMVSPRIKAQRIVMLNEETVKQIIINFAKLNGIDTAYSTLKLYWCDGLPIDEVELIAMLMQATGSKAVMSIYSALKKRGLSDEDVKKEMAAIKKDEDELAAAAPMLEVPRSVDEPDDTGGEE